MSGIDEQQSVCPICNKIPKEYLLNFIGDYGLWWVPPESRLIRRMKYAVILRNRSIEVKSFVSKVLVCDVRSLRCINCHNNIKDDTSDGASFIKRMVERVKNDLRCGNYISWYDFINFVT